MKVKSWSCKANLEVASERVACNAKFYCIQDFLSRYRIACYHITKHLTDEANRIEVTCNKAPNKADYRARHVQRGLVLSVRACVEKPIGHAQTSLNHR